MVTNNSPFRRSDYLKITVFGFALAALWGSLHTIIIQVRLLDFVAESEKTLWMGIITLAGLLLAIIVQPIAGAISDRSGFSWGRRRPFILGGTILVIMLLPGIGLSDSLFTLFIIYCLLQVASNTAQGPYQALIPDLVPGGRRGVASGVKSLLEFIGGLALVRMILYFMEHYFTEQREPWLWYTLALLAFLLLATMISTVLTVKERRGTGGPQLPLMSYFYKSFKTDVKASPDFILFLVSRFFILTAFLTMQRYALYFLMDAAGVDNPVAAMGNLLVVVGICMVVTVYPAGYLSDRIGRRPVAISSGLLGAVAILLVYLSGQNFTFITLCGALLGISSGGFMSSNWALATDLVPKGEEARYLGLTNLATAGSGALVGLMGLAIYFLNVSITGMGYSFMFLACFIYLIVGSLLLLKIRRR
jgi:Na+/melibiose symporter-like transporter